jgi:hypothetical protein
MTFKPKKPDLVARQLANLDEQIALRKARRTYLLQAEALRDRDLELQRENEEIAYQLRPEHASNVAFVDFRNGLRPTYGYVEAYADAA